MTGTARNLIHMRDTIETLSRTRPVFAYVLFDERAAHRTVADFLEKRFEWLKSLADASDMYILFFLRGKVKGVSKTVPAAGEAQNPSTQIAGWLNINLTRLPGIVIFSVTDEGLIYSFTKGVYLPLKQELFAEETAHLEEVFADLFTIIRNCRKKFAPDPLDLLAEEPEDASFSDLSEQFIQEVKKEINKLRRREKLRPFVQYLNGSVKNIAKLPNEFLLSVATAYGSELAKKTAGPTG